MKKLSLEQIAVLRLQKKNSVTASLIEKATVLAAEEMMKKMKYKGHTFELVELGRDMDTGAYEYDIRIDGNMVPGLVDTSPELAFDKAEQYVDKKKVKAEIAWDDQEAVVNDLATALGEQFKDEIRDSLDMEKGRYSQWGKAGQFKADGTEYNVIESEEEAERIAKEIVKQDLENEPELFTPSWLQEYMEVSDAPTIAQEMTDSEAEGMSDEDFVEQEGDKDEYDSLADDEKEAYVADAKEKFINKRANEMQQEIEQDPIQFFVKDHGIYSVEDLMKADFMSLNVEEATESAVEIDGWAHFLSHYDGNYESTPGGMVYFRES
jgi:hypothetical protein